MSANRGSLPSSTDNGDLLDAVSHELRTPLTMITGVARVLDGHPAIAADPVLQPLIGDLVNSSRRIRIALENMLALVRLEGDRSAPEPVLVRQAVRSAIDSVRRDFPGADLRIAAGDPADLTVDAVPGWLRLVLVNIMANAYLYGTPDTPIVVQWALRGHTARMTVGNSGPPVASARYEAWFQPFHRALDGSNLIPGTGLGLTVARRLTRALHGEVTAAPLETGPGTIVEVSLPQAQDG